LSKIVLLYVIAYSIAGKNTVGGGQWSVGSVQWSVGSGQWSVGSGQLAVSLREPQGPGFENSGQLAVFSCQWSVGSGFESLRDRGSLSHRSVMDFIRKKK